MASKEVLILGGGFAGLSCAVALSKAGVPVTVMEKKPHLGGRAYSFKDQASGEDVDNGQHLFMGCYRHTRRFLDSIGTTELLEFLPEVRVDYADDSGGRDVLSCPSFLGSPLHLAWGIMGLKGISWKDKIRLITLDTALRKTRKSGLLAGLDELTVTQWLNSLGQSPRIQERVFNPIALGALNEDPAIASAAGFAQVMNEMFFRDVESSRLGVSTVGLSALYVEAARRAIEGAGGRVLLSKKIVSVLMDGPSVVGVRAESGESFAGAVVSTLPPWDLARLELPEALRGSWSRLAPAPIVSLCLWLDRPVLTDRERLVGMLGTEIHWAFNKSLIFGRKPALGQYLSLVISGARRHIALDPKALLETARRDLTRCFPAFQKVKITAWKVVKEPFATLSPAPGSEALRPEPGAGAPGFYFAGDWTRTGLPATIESAVKSGHCVAERILNGG